MSEGSASTGIGHVSDWLTSCSACLCGFCHRTMEGLESTGSETSKLPAAVSWGDLPWAVAWLSLGHLPPSGKEPG